MHLPDGVITDPGVLTLGGGAAAIAIAVAHVECRRTLNERSIARAGVMAAFIFALQMVNFPVGFGASGHLLGGALAGIALGPWLGMICLAVVVIAQCLFFSDGGLLSLGVNVSAMALVATLSGGALASLLRRALPAPAAHFLAGWASVMLASVTMALAVTLGNPDAGLPFVRMMLGVHALIGLGEGLITAAVLSALARFQPDAAPRWRWRETVAGVALASGVVMGLSPFASSAPDGLEASLERATPVEPAQGANLPSPLNDYAVRGLANQMVAGVVAGLAGVALCVGLAHAALWPATRRRAAAER